MKCEGKQMRKFINQYVNISIGVLLVAIALEYFYYPNKIAAGGVSGLAIIINELTGISIGILMLIFNCLLFILAFTLIGGGFGAKSIYATFSLTGLLWFFEEFVKPSAVTDNLFLCTVFGSAIQAIGLAIIFNRNASTGGTSIIAKILNKFFHIDIGKSLLIVDFAVTLLAIYTFGAERGMFGLICVFLTGILVDQFIEGFNLCKTVLVISSKSEEIADFIIKELGRGCTFLDGRGAYTKEQTSILYAAVSRKQFIVLKYKIKELDPAAFITVSDAKEVLGMGFKDLVEE